jgi:hypothetical protein
MCLAFSSTERGTNSVTNQEMLRKERWLQVGAMQIEDHNIEFIKRLALDVEALLPEANARITQKAMLDDKH